MKKIIFFCSAFVVGLASCDNSSTEDSVEEAVVALEQDVTVSYASFGDEITPDGAIGGEDLVAKYKAMNEEDTLEVKFSGVIQKVCQKKGCWMNVALTDEDNTFIRFKDYGFFMPFNAAESNVIVNGKAFVSVISVDELKHYAEDEGKSQEEIDAITEPEVTYSFLADGVLIEE